MCMRSRYVREAPTQYLVMTWELMLWSQQGREAQSSSTRGRLLSLMVKEGDACLDGQISQMHPSGQQGGRWHSQATLTPCSEVTAWGPIKTISIKQYHQQWRVQKLHLFFWCVCLRLPTCHSTHQFSPSTCGSWGLNSGCHAWWQVP